MVVAIASAVSASAFAQSPEDLDRTLKDLDRKISEAERRIVRLPPASFRKLPANLVAELQRRCCRIPQLFSQADRREPQNVIRGEFAKPRQADWAVLCSVRGFSTILVFWNGSEKNPAALARRPDRDFLQGSEDGQFFYSREIQPVGKDFILRHQGYGAGPHAPPIDHQGIDDDFNGKGSVTWYLFRQEWLQLQGAD